MMISAQHLIVLSIFCVPISNDVSNLFLIFSCLTFSKNFFLIYTHNNLVKIFSCLRFPWDAINKSNFASFSTNTEFTFFFSLSSSRTFRIFLFSSESWGYRENVYYTAAVFFRRRPPRIQSVPKHLVWSIIFVLNILQIDVSKKNKSFLDTDLGESFLCVVQEKRLPVSAKTAQC